MRIRKRVHHFLMEYQGGEITALNDPDQEAEDAVWVRLHEAPQILSYANEQRIARVALALLYPDSPQTTKERGNSGSTGDQGPTGGKGSRAR